MTSRRVDPPEPVGDLVPTGENQGHRLQVIESKRPKSLTRSVSRPSERFIAIENPLELYLSEAYAAVSLGMRDWNMFRTH
jgi:hypothetical protein